MHIVMVSPELAPVAKVGGLADVVTGLARDLAAKGHTVEAMLPLYDCMRHDLVEDMEQIYDELWVPHFGEWHPEPVFRGTVQGLTCFFFPCGNRFHRERIYGYDDDLFRFAHFNRSVMEFMKQTERFPDILHLHDWQTGLVPVLLWEAYAGEGFAETRTVFTIHNIEHQGHCWYGEDLLASIGLDCGALFTFDRLRDNHKHNMINLMKGGIVYSSFVTTVSPTYCREVRAPEGGKGLDATLNAHGGKLGGVLNGLDYDFWNPETDPLLPHHYSADTFEPKYGCKDALRAQLGIPDEYRPLVSCISRLVPQKGVGLIQHAIRRTLERGGQFALLGESPDPAINSSFWNLREELGDNPNACIYIGHSEELAHFIYAGSDLIVVPSLFEPCGLTQLIGLRYGAVPVVRHTGGLADTVFDVDYSGLGFASANGFTFEDPNPDGLNSALDRALHCWFAKGNDFRKLAQNGMRCDYSWTRSGKDYENIYNHIRKS
jgi:starch synthase